MRLRALLPTLVLTGCAAGGTRAAAPTTATHPPTALEICDAALSAPVAAASLTTVEHVRGWEQGGPAPLGGIDKADPARHPGLHAFPLAGSTDVAAWCTVASGDQLTFYAAGTDHTSVELERVGNWTQGPPDVPVNIP
ncbi:MAG: hypothetical protein JWM93_2188 [Frankiales bacterium]|nr:hypothetical protein [Frankiales bacterium]